MHKHLFSNLPIDPRAAAVELARRGFSVFPCNPANKTPLTPNGFHDASSIPGEVAKMFSAGVMIGLPTGVLNGVIVVDIESVEGHGVDGDADVEALAADGFHLPDSICTVRTWSGGRHVYYRCPPEGRASFKFKRRGIEVKGDGGYVICPPSICSTGQFWEVIQ
ncbi:bifunctional DNA primase/polymerase [Bradyrhizobium sp. AS23.2]|uniref:bifunctional DNA primase/polymerase n=1 Tax=Bradyrhizobium sp. AS23.2 TaxID=1680155 RepID=UPI000938FF0C|nr:bifunctional DNA primase/polymerase [Bradyrhizobium sp. AS23.2]